MGLQTGILAIALANQRMLNANVVEKRPEGEGEASMSKPSMLLRKAATQQPSGWQVASPHPKPMHPANLISLLHFCLLWHARKPIQANRRYRIKHDKRPRDAKIPPAVLVLGADALEEDIRVAAGAKDARCG